MRTLADEMETTMQALNAGLTMEGVSSIAFYMITTLPHYLMDEYA